MIRIIENDNVECFKDYNELFLNKLFEEKVDYLRLTNDYVTYLEYLKNKNEIQLSEIDNPIMNVIKPMKHLKGKPTIDAIYRYLVKYKRFKGSPIWEELVKYVEDNNINLDGSYFNDLYIGDSND